MMQARTAAEAPLKVAVIGAGVAGLSCAWLLGERHNVTLYEAEERLGGHVHTVEVPIEGGPLAIDTGFIVYNVANYPNLTALFARLGVATRATEMSFGVSLDGGALEYGSAHPLALLAQPTNLLRPRFWSMLRDLVRFYREAPQALAALELQPQTLGELLDRGAYGRAFQEDHLLPQVGAIWSSSADQARDYPAASLIRFFENHGLLKILGRPAWRTVQGGSAAYVERLMQDYRGAVRLAAPVSEVRRTSQGVWVRETSGAEVSYDHVVLATHADQALRLLSTPTAGERELLGAFRYSRNVAVLHTDKALMPRRKAAWSAWNHMGRRGEAAGFCVTYWMNELQGLPEGQDFFVTLNPPQPPAAGTVLREIVYEHPLFDAAAMAAQRRLWSLQGDGGVWFCGAHFGAGFHEDGLQSRPGGGRTARGGTPAMAGGAGVRPYPCHSHSPAARGGARLSMDGSATEGSAIYLGRVGHTRSRPRRHSLSYGVFMMLLDLDELEALDRRLRWFSLARFNLLSFHPRDYGDRSATPLREQVQRHLREGRPAGGGAHPSALPPAGVRLRLQPAQPLFLRKRGR